MSWPGVPGGGGSVWAQDEGISHINRAAPPGWTKVETGEANLASMAALENILFYKLFTKLWPQLETGNLDKGLSGLRGSSLGNTVYMFGEDLLTLTSSHTVLRRPGQRLPEDGQDLEVQCQEEGLGGGGNNEARQVLPGGLCGQSRGFLSWYQLNKIL